MRVCVTGGAGFIGSHLVERLVHDGHNVTVVDSFITGSMDNLARVAGSIRLQHLDLSQPSPVLPQLLQGVECVFHLAAVPSVTSSVADPLASHANCGTATLVLLEAARRCGVPRVIFSSSCAVYGEQRELPWHTGMTPHPTSPYAADKLASEHYMEVYHRLYGMTTVSLRYFNVYGRRQPVGSDYAAVIPKFRKAMAHGAPAVFYGDGSQTRDFVNVADVVEANLLAAAYPGCGLFNVASGRQTSIRELHGLMAGITGHSKPPEILPARPGEVIHSYAETATTAKELGFQARVDLRGGLAKLLG